MDNTDTVDLEFKPQRDNGIEYFKTPLYLSTTELPKYDVRLIHVTNRKIKIHISNDRNNLQIKYINDKQERMID